MQQTGARPPEWLNAQRVRRSQALLETTDHTVDRVAALSGFGTAVALGRNFHEVVGTTPDAYRRTFCGGHTAAVGG